MSRVDADAEKVICRSCSAINSYFKFKCTRCGLNLIPWHLRECLNQKCDNIVSITEARCPACDTACRVGLIGNSFKLYLVFTNPLFKSRGSRNAFLAQTSIYIGVIIGILLGDFVRGTKSQINSSVDFVIAGLIGFVILPSVFQDDYFSSDAPFVAKLGMAVQRGVFSDLVLAATEKGLS